jgi:hypothetical protein
MISNTTYDIIATVAKQYVPDKQHSLLHINSMDAWIELVSAMVEKGLVKPRMAVLLKCAHSWETLLTLKYSRLN